MFIYGRIPVLTSLSIFSSGLFYSCKSDIHHNYIIQECFILKKSNFKPQDSTLPSPCFVELQYCCSISWDPPADAYNDHRTIQALWHYVWAAHLHFSLSPACHTQLNSLLSGTLYELLLLGGTVKPDFPLTDLLLTPPAYSLSYFHTNKSSSVCTPSVAGCF